MAGIITALEVQKGDQRRVNVFIDGAFSMGLYASVAAGLRVGQQVAQEEVERLQAEEAVEQAHQRALRLLGRRPHSIEEIRRKLLQRRKPAEAVDQAIDRLVDSGLLDDASFAAAWIENRMLFRPRGLKMLRYELGKRGVSRAVIDEALDGFDDGAAAQSAGEKAFSRYQGLAPELARERMLAYLARRGFPFGLSRSVVEALLSVEESEVEA